jgi:hypothetical protein
VGCPPMNEVLPHPSPRRSLARDLSSDDSVLADAWGQVAPQVESFHCGRFENGGVCISVAVKARDGAETEAMSAWLVWPEAGEIVVKGIGAQPHRSHHATVRAALEVICPLSAMQWRSAELIAEAMLAYHRALEAEQSDQDLSLAA